MDEQRDSKKKQVGIGFLIFFSIVGLIGLELSVGFWFISVTNIPWVTMLWFFSLIGLPILLIDRLSRKFDSEHYPTDLSGFTGF